MKHYFLKYSSVLLLSLTTLLYSCLETTEVYDPYQQIKADTEKIDAYLQLQGQTAVKDVNGVRMVIHTLGQGLPANANNNVKVDYVGTVLQETSPFENGTATGAVRNFIVGWQIVLTTLPVGSHATVYIPSPLGYGNTAQTKIPANSILVFDINFKEVTLSETEKQRFTSDTTALNNYINSKNLTNVVKDPSGVRYVITEEGTGAKPGIYAPVKAKLDFKLLTDDTKSVVAVTREPAANFLSRVVDNIPGVIAALRQMKEGAKATVFVPSLHGFNTQGLINNGATLIPANANLIIEVELLDVI